MLWIGKHGNDTKLCQTGTMWPRPWPLDAESDVNRLPAMVQGPSPVAMRFGQSLRAIRTEAGFPSQAALSRATAMAAAEICRYETGKALPTLAVFARLTRAGLDPIPLLAAFDPEPGDQPSAPGGAP